MTEPVRLHVNDYGVHFNLTIKDQDDSVVDISTNSGTFITFLRPDKTTFNRTPVIPNGGTDGLLRYTLQSGELSQVGIWSLSATVILNSGTFHSNIPEFRVLPNLN